MYTLFSTEYFDLVLIIIWIWINSRYEISIYWLNTIHSLFILLLIIEPQTYRLIQKRKWAKSSKRFRCGSPLLPSSDRMLPDMRPMCLLWSRVRLNWRDNLANELSKLRRVAYIHSLLNPILFDGEYILVRREILLANDGYVIRAFDDETGNRVRRVEKSWSIVNASQSFVQVIEALLHLFGIPIQWCIEIFQRCNELNIIFWNVYRHCKSVAQSMPFLEWNKNGKYEVKLGKWYFSWCVNSFRVPEAAWSERELDIGDDAQMLLIEWTHLRSWKPLRSASSSSTHQLVRRMLYLCESDYPEWESFRFDASIL